MSSSPAAFFAEGGDDVGAALLVALEADDLLLGGLLQQLRERRVPVVRLVESRVLADHRLLHHRAPQRFLVLALQGLDGVDELGDGLGLLLEQALQDQLELELLVLRFLDSAGDVLEVDEHGQLPFSVHPSPFLQRPPLYVRPGASSGGFIVAVMAKPIDPALTSRVPPGQRLTEKWPVLTYGMTPRFDPARWTFRCFGLVEREVQWTWAEFQALPRVRVRSHIHCVTRWSKLDNE